MEIVIKDVGSVEDFTLPWVRRLGTAQIVSSSFTVAPAGVVLSQPSYTDTTATVRVAGGVPGALYEVQNQVGLSTGETLVYRFLLRIFPY